MHDLPPKPGSVDPAEYSTAAWVRCALIAALGFALYWSGRTIAEAIAAPHWGATLGLPHARILGHLITYGPAYLLGRLMAADPVSARLPPTAPALAAAVNILVAAKSRQDPADVAMLFDAVLRCGTFYFLYAGLKGRLPRP